MVGNWLPLQQAAPPAAHRGNSSLNLGGSSSTCRDPKAAQSILWWLVFLWGLQASCWILAPGGEGSRGSCGPAVGGCGCSHHRSPGGRVCFCWGPVVTGEANVLPGQALWRDPSQGPTCRAQRAVLCIEAWTCAVSSEWPGPGEYTPRAFSMASLHPEGTGRVPSSRRALPSPPCWRPCTEAAQGRSGSGPL